MMHGQKNIKLNNDSLQKVNFRFPELFPRFQEVPVVNLAFRTGFSDFFIVVFLFSSQ